MDDIASLSSKLKQVIILHYLNELTQEEIAEILGIPAEGDEGTGTAEQQRRSAGKITSDTLGEEDPIDQIIQLTPGTGKALYVADGNPDRIISNQTDYAQEP